MTDQERIKVALGCQDCDGIPRVAGAGSITSSPGGSYQIMHNGLKLYCDSHYGDYNVEVIRGLQGHHEPQEEAIFHAVLPRILPGGGIMELGAFWGYYSLWFLKAVPHSRAMLIEPVPFALEAGRRNFTLNEAEGTFIHAAIGAAPAAEVPVELWRGMSVSVSTDSVDSLMVAQGLERLSILHADIQGHEVAMLQGASAALFLKAIDWIFISTHGENIHQRCLQLLRRARYHIAAAHTLGESFSVDGLIVASAHVGPPLPPVSRSKMPGAFRAKLRAIVRVRMLEPLGLKPVTT